ncbi:hypothetical protein DRJ25_06295 [Candidatus Woesearchaeota archaeon]|nr:MAG: hypothetical protein DRJ25_06295 [Candidatus Woesearchaeota archaeon]
MLKRAIITSFAIVLIVSQLFWIATPISAQSQERKLEMIYISDKNVKDLVSEGILNGSGTPDDPYVLENYIVYSSVLPGIWIVNVSNIVIRDVIITKFRNVTGFGRSGISIQNATNVVIESVQINYVVHGILIGNSKNIKIKDLDFFINNDVGYALQFYNCTDVMIENIRVASGHVMLVRGDHKENYDIKVKDVYKAYGMILFRPFKYYFDVDEVYLAPEETQKLEERMYGGMFIAYAKKVVLDSIYLADDLLVINVDEFGAWNIRIEGANYGIYVKNTSKVGVYCSVMNNTVYGILVDDSQSVSIKSSMINFNSYGVYLSNADSFNISHNFINKSTVNSIYVKNSRNGSILYNILTNVGNQAILLDDGTENVKVAFNTIYNVGQLSEHYTFYATDNGKNNTWTSNFYGPFTPAEVYNITGSARASDTSPMLQPIPTLFLTLGINSFPSKERTLYVMVEVAIFDENNGTIVGLGNQTVVINGKTLTTDPTKGWIGNYLTFDDDVIVAEYNNTELIIPLPEISVKKSILGYLGIGLVVLGVGLIAFGIYMSQKQKRR